MKIQNNNDFFKKPTTCQIGEQTCEKRPLPHSDSTENPSTEVKLHASASVMQLAKQAEEVLSKCGLAAMADQVKKIVNDATKERFVVSFVGEFSRGKSTLLNKILNDAASLPVGNLPTTAVMTRIRYAKQPKMAVLDEKGTRVAMLDVKPESWENLIANNFSKEQPQGSVIIGIPDPWLASNSMELIDCPGAGDLSEERTKQIADTLARTDGAVICLSGTAALGMTEKEFILQRILKQKTPFSMVVINKLDLVKLEQRNGIVDYVKAKLAHNKMDIPVFIPGIEMPDDKYKDINGLDKIMSTIASWSNNPQRQELTDLWIKARIQNIVYMAIDSLKEQIKLYDADEEKCRKIILEKKNALAKLDLLWGELELNLQNRANECYNQFLNKVREYKETTIERLQYEAGHAASPDKWWQEDYPYRLKVELANMSVGLDNVISHIIATDARWFNQMLDQKFRNFVQVESTSVTDKTDFTSEKSKRKIEFEDLGRKQNIARLGTAALSIISACTLGIVGTIGIGAGGAVLQNKFFKSKLEEQRKHLKDSIAKDIPQIVDDAISKSEQRIKQLYDNILGQSSQKKRLWIEAQTVAIESENKPKTSEQKKALKENISLLETIKEKLN